MIKPVALGTAALLLQSLVAPCGAQLTSRIAFVSGRDGNNEIYVMETDGSDQRNLTHGPWSDIAPCWSPDGRRIAFASDRKGSYDIHVMDADGGNLVRLTESPGVDAAPAWSPAGSRIVYSGYPGSMDWTIYMVDAEGRNQVQLTASAAWNSHEGDHDPAWSPPMEDETQVPPASWGQVKAESRRQGSVRR